MIVSVRIVQLNIHKLYHFYQNCVLLQIYLKKEIIICLKEGIHNLWLL